MSNTSPSIRILLLEDNEIDKHIIHSTIEKSDLNFSVLIVDTKSGFFDALQSYQPDVVLSDYVLPDFNGLEALKMHKEAIPDIPFIFVTGQLSEEAAIECLKLGAWDYIMKDHIKRLPVSIKSVLDLKLERQANREKERLIKESEKRYKTLSELTFEGVVIHKQGVVLDCNLSFCRMFGYERAELIGKDVINSLVHPEYRQLIREHSEKGITTPYEAMALRKDGSTFPVEQEGKAIFYNNEPARVVAIRDITSRHETMAELKLSEEKFNKISNAAKDAIILIDHRGNVSFWNKAATELFQYSAGEMLGNHFHSIIAPEKYLADHQKGFEKFLETGKGPVVGKIVELEAKRKDGRLIPVELSLSSINIHGKWNAVGIIRDISARKRVEAEMDAARQYAQEMNEMKTNFISTMSHELRTPLNGILGFSEILFEELEDSEAKDYAETILKSAERILNTFNLVIDLAVLDANKVKVNKKSENINSIVGDACNAYRSEALARGLTLEQKSEPKEIVAEIDQDLLTQALNNLLNNALKYTQKGGVTVVLKRVRANGIRCFAVVVSDTGIGIPKEKASLIYHAFRQVSEGYNRSYEGMGLGLYITKKYVDLLDGYIELNSREGKGSEFIIYIPVKGSETLAEATAVDVDEMSGNRRPEILYVEDDPSHRQFMKMFLRQDYHVTCVKNAEDAIEAAGKTQFDMILMDINLGVGMNGLEAVEVIRKIPAYKTVPIVAVTANALVSQKNEYLSRGCTDFIAKPFRKKKLIDFIEKNLTARS